MLVHFIGTRAPSCALAQKKDQDWLPGRSHFLVATNPDAPGAGLSALSVCISARISSSDGVGAGAAPRPAPRSCGPRCPEVSAAVHSGIRPYPAALDPPRQGDAGGTGGAGMTAHGSERDSGRPTARKTFRLVGMT